MNRRHFLYIASTGAMGTLAGCMDESDPESITEDSKETQAQTTVETADNTTEEVEPSFEIEAQGVTGTDIDSVKLNGELTEIQGYSEVECYLLSGHSDVDWDEFDLRSNYLAEILSEPGEFSTEFPQRGALYGGREYKYRVLGIASNGTEKRGEVKSFSLEDLDVEKPQISFGDAELTKPGNAIVRVPIENTGQMRSGEIIARVQWFDSEGTLLGRSKDTLFTLFPGEKGFLWSSSYAEAPADEIEDFELETSYRADGFEEVEGMEVVESTIESEPRSQVTGVATNTLENPPGSVDAVARFFDDEGRVLGDSVRGQTTAGIPQGTNWQFTIYIHGDMQDVLAEASDHEVILAQG